MSDSNLQPINNFVIFKTESGKVNIDVFYQEQTLWLTQKTIAELFEKGRSTITEHLKNIFESGELEENSVCRDFRHTAEDGKVYQTKYYNLRAITAVGYRVNSQRATEFSNDKFEENATSSNFGSLEIVLSPTQTPEGLKAMIETYENFLKRQIV